MFGGPFDGPGAPWLFLMTHPILFLHEIAEMGGAEKSLLGLLQRLDRRQFVPFFLCGEGGPLVEKLRQSGISAEVLPFPRARQFSFWRVYRTVGRIRSYIREHRVALVHSNSPRTNFYAGVAGRLERIPVIWHARNLISPFHEGLDLDRLFSFLPCRIVCVSKGVQERFHGIPKAVTIYSGVDLDEFRPGINGRPLRERWGFSESQLVVGMVGRIGPGKGHEEFLQALSMAVRAKEETRGVIVGKAFKDAQEMETRLRALAGKLELDSKITFAGFQEDIPNVMAGLDIFVLFTHAEPFSRALLEAMASGKAVIATRAGGSLEVVTNQQTGLLVSPKNPREMAEAILFLAARPGERDRLGREARLCVERSFSIQAHVRAVESLYKELLLKE